MNYSSGRIRLLGLVAVLLGGSYVLFRVVNGHYAVEHWLFFRYAVYWAVADLFGLCCLLFGGALLSWLRVALPPGESFVLSLALGTYTFALSVFASGVLHVLGAKFAFALPIAMTLLGTYGLRHRLRSYILFAQRALSAPVRIASPFAVALLLFGLAGAALAYVPILTPHNVSADARWYHLPIAESYAAEGGISRSAEGSFVAAYPLLATYLYTWAFLLPNSTIFDRIELCGHLEYILFLATLAGVGVLASMVSRHARASLAWPVMFLFPGLFLYDSSMNLGADHVLAFWAAPIFIALLRALPSMSPQPCFLLGAMLAGAILTKHQAPCITAAPLVAVVVRGVFLATRRGNSESRRRAVFGTAIAITSALALSAPHWAKNILWYHDPIYPLLHNFLPSTPWGPDATLYFDRVFVPNNLWRPVGTLPERLQETFLALFTFSFLPHDWSGFHGTVPVFGSLFTLLSFSLPFVRARFRLIGLVLSCYGALFIWYSGSHQDRYLQAFLPWMAAATAALIAEVWCSGALSRAALSALVGLQVIWGGDVPFLPGHTVGQNPLRVVVELLSTGYRKAWDERDHIYEPWTSLGKRIPKGSKVLVHGCHSTLGLNAALVTDFWAGGISYGRYKSFGAMNRALTTMGVTHLVWQTDVAPGIANIADDLLFYSFATRYGDSLLRSGPLNAAELPADGPSDAPFGLVLIWGTGNSYAPGLYPVDALTRPDPDIGFGGPYPMPLRAAHQDEPALLESAEFAVLDVAASGDFTPPGFARVMHRGAYTFWIRNVPPGHP